MRVTAVPAGVAARRGGSRCTATARCLVTEGRYCTRAGCCWYHRVDWHAVSETAIRLARQHQAADIPVDDISETVATTFGRLAGADLEALAALLDVDNGIIIVDDDPDDPWINEGRHRITAMRDTGVRRPSLSASS